MVRITTKEVRWERRWGCCWTKSYRTEEAEKNGIEEEIAPML